MMTAAFSPTPRAVLYVLAETLLGQMESYENNGHEYGAAHFVGNVHLKSGL